LAGSQQRPPRAGPASRRCEKQADSSPF